MLVDGLGLRRHGAKTFFQWDFASVVISISTSVEDELALEVPH